MRSIVVHLHLYQPPREDPWLGEIEREPEAAPDHDWTARVERTSYRALAAARVLDGEGRVRRVVETFAQASFDAAPTLLAWMADQAPATYAALVAADRASRARLGFGNALAHPYDHAILPLLSRRDKVTEVRWGIADFRRRFGRDPDGMWCPETAVDDETLDVLAEHGMRFTIVAPHQLTTLPPDGRPGRYRTAGGREIALMAYDDALARAVAFGPLLRDGRAWARRMAGDETADATGAGENAGGVASVATVAETYGHHHPFGEMALAAMLEAAAARPHVQVENFASLLARWPAAHDVALVGPSSWSCPHGVERWRRDCGCHADASTSQRWRAPLRAAVTALQHALDQRFAHDGAALFGERGLDPWTVRDAYLADGVGAVPETRDPVWARELLEMARESLRLNTSGAWFGDLLDRPEVRTMLRHAARALALGGPHHGPAAERAFLQALDDVPLDDAADANAGGTAGDLYVRHARPALPAAVRVAAGWAAVRAVGLAGEAAVPDAWRVAVEDDAGGNLAESVVTVADRRLGATARLAVRVDVPGPAGSPAAAREATDNGASEGAPFRMADVDPRAITILVRPEGGHALEVRGIPSGLAIAVKLSDVPERARHAVELALRRAVVHRLLDPDERALLAAGEATLAALVEAALVRAVQRLALDASPAAQARVHGLADLAESTGNGVPADAQTMLARVRGVVGLEVRERLAPVAWRLGFSTRAWLGESDATA
ncbi:DUF3536 domain-containing protein [Roseisolibacter agri]|uniref:Glycoside hydrolase family 57 N-terminal domain-containing protein n=1 Tax=Roseisolibacter agri TaxID=2014610 RepID=A0AA37QGV4_9BACT|nr:DUF3536 domain-containing protein [Roseisolibacter agri]GLC25553.1 hypothetical protein rosag_20660 [Roseisolibacter agri]